ncbi:hypothetical protein [Rhodothermus marinus]|uniref:hypothetical protein n=1 Tax=Rhodothermus marinus TaxID=29549 RepID=UPI001FB2D3A1|nr:hypothetical protein [Rhodothermus marinus]
MSTADVQPYVQRRDELARMLEPPVISGITVQTERLSETHTTTLDGTGGVGTAGVAGARAIGIAPAVAIYHRPAFMSRARIQWQATHPDGLGPAAVRIQSGAAVVAQDSLFSVGTRATFTQWRFRRGSASDLLSRSYTVTVQVRGSAGYGTSRTAPTSYPPSTVRAIRRTG